jgi:hypothetical protein
LSTADEPGRRMVDKKASEVWLKAPKELDGKKLETNGLLEVAETNIGIVTLESTGGGLRMMFTGKV